MRKYIVFHLVNNETYCFSFMADTMQDAIDYIKSHVTKNWSMFFRILPFDFKDSISVQYINNNLIIA